MYEGTLVRLRTMEPSDAERLLTWINDPDVTEHLAVRYPMSLANEVDWVETNKTVNYGNAVFAVETIAEGRHIGGVDIRTGSGPENRKGELGLMVGDKSVWGGGYGTDLVRTACRFGFDEMNLNRSSCGCTAATSGRSACTSGSASSARVPPGRVGTSAGSTTTWC
jgi:RimJ/RimL family protein N-acetyltransferase